MSIFVRLANSDDVVAIAAIHRQAFTRQSDSEVWVRATMAAWPRMLVHLLIQADEVAGYIFWAQKSGIRPSAVVELDQVAVTAQLRGRGLGELLIRESLAQVRGVLECNGQSLKSILVSIRADNEAQRLYQKSLGARVVAEIDDMYSSTEVLMLAEAVDG
ncbi:GNAT family N-acetyltransferase [Vreelandella sp. F11]|uniref:GNAT family N-acetyltransferase n=1 Tax=Vreelandella sp. F11 TaxID=3394751 RepID=UPI0036DCC87F